MTMLLLVRHAAHDTVDRVLCGRAPGVHLGALGLAQAGRLGRRLRRDRPAALFTSPQPRAAETAAEIAPALGLDPESCAALDEIDFGEWTGRSFAALETDRRWRAWNASRATARAPGGEAMQDAAARILAWTGALPARHAGRNVVAVTHAEVIRAAIACHLGLSLDALWRIEVAPASVSAIELWEGGGRVRLVNDAAAAEA